MVTRWSEEDLRFMRRALKLASRGYPAPNPLVGAVLVQNGEVVAEGYHRRVGTAHAEAIALEKAGAKARGATLYVTLEPCCHHGRTPPCTEAIVAAGVSRVVAAVKDPNPLVRGGGVRRLRRAGLRVEVGLLEDEARAQNRMHFHFHKTGRPWVTVKAAMSLDGKIATVTGESKWITDDDARRMAHRLRAEHAAVLVGARTAKLDRPNLTVRIPGVRAKPLRVLLDYHLRGPEASTLYDGEAETVVFFAKASVVTRKRLQSLPVRLEQVRGSEGRLDPREVLGRLASWGITSVLVEGGGEVIASFLEARVVDRVCFFYAPLIIGGAQAKTAVEGTGVETIARAVRLRNASMVRAGSGWMLDGEPDYPME
ncbi:MAG: bifunctional diaminohydroxyphosphoribosylaminopyrimidine deaminase/5-amino-6-(5-phosphoribosylamino)uracil reductase RibD [Fimbriimonadia bacterium]|jgi:diaminohydroxyphosphoribosylaminopyrimidine deaminase/5-amino-6-(5-phosphoribosylamino)uracil reductase